MAEVLEDVGDLARTINRSSIARYNADGEPIETPTRQAA